LTKARDSSTCRLFLAVLLTVATTGAASGDVPSAALALLTDELVFGADDVADLVRGRIVKKTLDAHDPDTVVAVGAVRVGVPREFLLEQIRDIVSFKKSEYVLEIGTFGTPPRPEDVATLSLSADDVDAIRRCRPDDCGIKLTAGMLERLEQDVDWTRPDRQARATTVFRQLLVERAVAYLAEGAAALGTYVDKPGAGEVAEDMSALLAATDLLTRHAPELSRFFEHFPAEPDGTESFLYWSKEVFGLKPVISVTHVVIHTTRLDGTPLSFVASRGVYASHYFDGSLALTLAVEAADASTPAVYLVYVNRSRVDSLGGALGGLKRWIASRRVRDGMDDTLKGVRQRLEENYRGQQGATSNE
jgi:hypothetical protein